MRSICDTLVAVHGVIFRTKLEAQIWFAYLPTCCWGNWSNPNHSNYNSYWPKQRILINNACGSDVFITSLSRWSKIDISNLDFNSAFRTEFIAMGKTLRTLLTETLSATIWILQDRHSALHHLSNCTKLRIQILFQF